ncbi:hypothetical protein MTO96_013199 [Rhipicephalus appendiculatus]
MSAEFVSSSRHVMSGIQREDRSSPESITAPAFDAPEFFPRRSRQSGAPLMDGVGPHLLLSPKHAQGRLGAEWPPGKIPRLTAAGRRRPAATKRLINCAVYGPAQ